MVNNYFIDKIVIVSITEDKWSVKTESLSSELDSRVEDSNRLLLNKDGQEVMGDMLVFLDKDTTLKYDDKIIIKTKGGVAYEQPDKRFIIKKIALMQGFTGSHLEVDV